MSTRWHIAAGLTALAVLATAMLGCDEDSNPDVKAEVPKAKIPKVTVVAEEYRYEMPETVPAGLVTLTLRNEGMEPHHAQPARLKDGVTLERFTAELQKGAEAALPLLAFPGGPGPLAPDGSQEVTLDLAEGQYVMLCFVESPDGTPHLAKGMITPFRVTTTAASVREPSPRAGGQVTLRDFSFSLPTIEVGERTLTVTNAGPQVHEMGVVKLEAGKTLGDVRAFLQSQAGPPPFTPVGGFQAIDPGRSGWLTLDLTPGNYLALCLIPDPATGKPHTELGMIQPFTMQ